MNELKCCPGPMGLNMGNSRTAWVNVQRNPEESTEPRGPRGWAFGRVEVGPAGKERLFSGGVWEREKGKGEEREVQVKQQV